jgi:Arc/MetJ-type ribon-helix-helix transcriptional regulator
MATAKVAITLEKNTLAEVDRCVREGRFPNRSRAVQSALADMLARQKRRRLVDELRQLDRSEERAFTEERFAGELPWPEY